MAAKYIFLQDFFELIRKFQYQMKSNQMCTTTTMCNCKVKTEFLFHQRVSSIAVTQSLPMTQCQQSLFWKMLLSLLLLAYLLEKETPEVQLYFFSIMKNHNKEPMHEGWFYKPSYGQDILSRGAIISKFVFSKTIFVYTKTCTYLFCKLK